LLNVAKRNETFASAFIEKLQQASSDDRILHKLYHYVLHPAHEQLTTASDLSCGAAITHLLCGISLSLFEGAMDISERFVRSRSLKRMEQFDPTRLVGITDGAFPVWLNPFGMLDP
jgi:hypothetical protein